MLLLLIGITFLFLTVNISLADNDYMHPSVIVCVVFLLYETVCLAVRNTYAIEFHAQTVMVVTCMLALFTAVTGILNYKRKKSASNLYVPAQKPEIIRVPVWIVAVLILLQLVTILFFIRYIRAIGAAWQDKINEVAAGTAYAIGRFGGDFSGKAVLEDYVSSYVGYSVHDIVRDSAGNITADVDCIGQIFMGVDGTVTAPYVDRSIGSLINLYDTMTKFWTGIFNSLSVPVPFLYRVLNPVCSAAAYMLLYVEVNNFVAAKKLNILNLASVFLMCILIVLNGSRSPLFRVFTMAVILLYVFNFRKHPAVRGSIKTLFRVAIALAGLAVMMFVALRVMGRAGNMVKLTEYLFTYMGAPLVNLDNFIAGNDIGLFRGCAEANGTSALFGAQTFRGLYNYAGKIFNIEKFGYDGISFFAFSNNGIEIGNVYTTLYYPIYDFGFIGVLPVISIIAFYYVGSYRKCIFRPGRNVIDFRLFIYSYLFNDLIMLAFSNRFFETVLDAPFLKMLLMSFIYDVFIFEHGLKTQRINIKLSRRTGGQIERA